MDAKNNTVEKSSSNLRRVFSHVFDWDKMDVNYSKVDLSDKCIFAMPSSYEWHLIYFDNDLDLLISERVVPGIQYWHDYSSKYSDVFLKNNKIGLKVDICTQYKNVFELLSINSKINLSHADMMTIFKWKPIIAYYAHRIWNQEQDIILPLREDIPVPESILENYNSNPDESLDRYPYMRFGNIFFTRKEIITIRLLLSNRKAKEISAIQRCSVTTENARIQRIKEKLSCKHDSLIELIKTLKEHDITLSCLDRLTVYP
ncbi:hypothetical protein [Yersinia sp. Marseille-Q3913]|uniref:helix-turn-helix transcriptional regulator n=1 Tax=Yersinia sp. Marseille-Q3913 TaxID=2830769 RepID=UPI001BB005AB|nr:hypothetical protein [Yersinia sp. Marseille-Q3913]MBS0055827.1 hypothetical protein [Yersinia sp. Marseille-Q3913]